MAENQTPAPVESLSPGRRAVLAALVEFPETTVIALSDAAQVPRSSTAAALKYLEERGLATRKIFPILDGKPRPADIWSASATAAPFLSSNVDAGTAQNDSEPAPTQEPASVLSNGAPEHDAESSVVADLPELITDKAATPTVPARMGKGVLRDAVRRHLLANPGKSFTPTALSKALARSSGAISNALDVLVARGEAVMVLEKPRTFQAPESLP